MRNLLHVTLRFHCALYDWFYVTVTENTENGSNRLRSLIGNVAGDGALATLVNQVSETFGNRFQLRIVAVSARDQVVDQFGVCSSPIRG